VNIGEIHKYSEDDLLPISALQHLMFCERQWGLIHLERMWKENRLTAEGRLLHDRTHEPGAEARGGVRIARGLRLRSLRLGLTGQADVVEFHAVPNGGQPPAEQSAEFAVQRQSDSWQPFPIEYKRGKPKFDRCDEVQLCAQALCLEEMLSVSVLRGALFYGRPRRRTEVAFDESLRRETEQLAARLHELTRSAQTPPARYEKKCESRSLISVCLPRATGGSRSASRYLSGAIDEIAGSTAQETP
jgi:CRISPR-associated exonuclease Cas4